MSTQFLSRASVLGAALATAIAGASCMSSTSAPPPQPAPPSPIKRVDAAMAGTITGRVTLAGSRPRPERLNMSSDPACTAGGSAQVESDALLVASDGALQNAFVFIKDGLDPAYTFDVPADPVVLDQKGCRYAPRIAGARVGQPVDVVNDDPTFHNVHGIATRNAEFNQAQPNRFMRDRRIFTAPETMVHLKCDVHNWMDAYVGVLDHPFFAVTGADGSFALHGVPPGTYTLEAWHEKLGVRTTQLTLAGRQAQAVSFAFGE